MIVAAMRGESVNLHRLTGGQGRPPLLQQFIVGGVQSKAQKVVKN